MSDEKIKKAITKTRLCNVAMGLYVPTLTTPNQLIGD